MLDAILDILMVLALLAALLVIGYVFLVVQALYSDLKERGIAPGLVRKPEDAKDFITPLTRAAKQLKERCG